MENSSENGTEFNPSLPVLVLSRPKGQPGVEWQELEREDGVYHISAGHEISVRVHSLDDADLKILVSELASLPSLTYLNLSENRNITDIGLAFLRDLPQITGLNISSCSITSSGMASLQWLTKLESLDLSYCNRITDAGLKCLKKLNRLAILNVQGCVKLTNGGLSRMGKKNLKINRGH